MRGKDGQIAVNIDARGITPAHAGKRCPRSQRRAARWDHPRPCGEKKMYGEICSSDMGSPPPMRGKGALGPSDEGLTGITPAHAGKREAPDGYGIGDRDHPRPCGEKHLF